MRSLCATKGVHARWLRQPLPQRRAATPAPRIAV